MCLDTLLELVQHMAGRLSEVRRRLPPSFCPFPAHPPSLPQSGSASRPSSPSSSSAINASAVLSSKSSKRRLLEGAAAFNLKPKVGLKYLEEHGLIYAEQPPIPRPESLARFFRNAPKLDKKVLGEFISRPEQLDVLKAFMQGLDFKGVRLPALFSPPPSPHSQGAALMVEEPLERRRKSSATPSATYSKASAFPASPSRSLV